MTSTLDCVGVSTVRNTSGGTYCLEHIAVLETLTQVEALCDVFVIAGVESFRLPL